MLVKISFILFIIVNFENVSAFWTDPPELLKVFLDSASVVDRENLALPHTSKVCITDLPTVRSAANQAEAIRNELLLSLNQLPEVSGVFSNLISKAANTILELMSDGNSTLLLDVTGKTGRMFTDTTTSFAKLLTTTERFIEPIKNNEKHPEYDAELIASKLKLIQTTRETLNDFLTELSKLSEISFEDNEKTKDILHAEQLLIDKTKESYQIVYDTTNKILRQVLSTNLASKPVKKIIAARILHSASNNLNAFANLRNNISHALADVAIKNSVGDAVIDDFRNHMKNELLAEGWKDNIADKDLHLKLPLTVEEKKELEDLIGDYKEASTKE